MAAESTDLRILLLADSLQESISLRSTLEGHLPPGTVMDVVGLVEDGRALLSQAEWCYDAALLGWTLGDGSGRELVPLMHARCKAAGRRPPAIFVEVDTSNGAATEIGSLLRRFPDTTLVEKPYFLDELASMIVDAVLPRSSDGDGYYGLRLLDLIQAYTLPRRTATLRLFAPDGRIGVVAVREGQLVHAAIGGEQGVDALTEMMRIRGGRIRLDRGCTTALRTIRTTTEQALIHAARLVDEHERDTLVEE